MLDRTCAGSRRGPVTHALEYANSLSENQDLQRAPEPTFFSQKIWELPRWAPEPQSPSPALASFTCPG